MGWGEGAGEGAVQGWEDGKGAVHGREVGEGAGEGRSRDLEEQTREGKMVTWNKKRKGCVKARGGVGGGHGED